MRKALKKFEKVTKIPAQQAYTTEKIEPNTFASSKSVENMTHEMEDLFAARFTRGDKKRAMARLRGGVRANSHHLSTFRSGLLLGLAIPALAEGICLSTLSFGRPSSHDGCFNFCPFRFPAQYTRCHSCMGWFIVCLLCVLSSRGVLAACWP